MIRIFVMITLPRLGLGCAPLGGLLDGVSQSDSQEVFGVAAKNNVTYFDTAPFYGFGLSERRTGDALRGRDDTIISTKVGRIMKKGGWENPEEFGWPAALPFHHVYDYTYDGVMRSYEDSLQRLGLDKIDILYLHDIGAETHPDHDEEAKHFKDAMSGGYRALEELRCAGDISGFGIGVNEIDVSTRALDHGDWDVFLLAGRYTLLEQEPINALFPKCQKYGTEIVVGGPYNSGVLVGGDTWNYAKVPEHVSRRVQEIRNVCDRHDVLLPSAALQFCLANPVVSTVIPGARTAQELIETVAWLDLTIPLDFWAEMKCANLLDQAAPTP